MHKPPGDPSPADNSPARAQCLPYTSWEFCCFSSFTMSTTMARKDLSLVYPVGGKSGHPHKTEGSQHPSPAKGNRGAIEATLQPG